MSRAISRMKKGNATGVSELTAEMLNAAGELGTILITDPLNAIIDECFILDDCHRSVIVNVHKGKGDALDRWNNRGITLLNEIMKVMPRVLGGND